VGNVLENALDAVEARGLVEIVVTTDERMAAIRISNTGSYIPVERRTEIFGFGVTGGKPLGTGLGLAMAQAFVIANEGSIACDSDVRSGTSFTFRIPLARSSTTLASSASAAPDSTRDWPTLLGSPSDASESPEAREPAEAQALFAGFARATVIVVDDDALVRLAWKRALAGIEVAAFASPSDVERCLDARDRMDEQKIYVLDFFYEGHATNGVDLAAAIKRRSPRSRILLSTSMSRAQLLRHPAWRGEEEALSITAVVGKKPLAWPELEAVIDLRNAPRTLGGVS